MAAVLDSHLGKVYLLGSNPRQIRDGAFNALCESIERDPEFMMLRGIIVWLVPHDLKAVEGRKSPFEGQNGKLVILGGNMRANALKSLGYGELKREWLVEARDGNGDWITPEKAERLVLVDNGSIGIAGSNDYEKMLKSFNEDTMRQSGIDFSEFEELLAKGLSSMSLTGKTEDGKTIEDEIEEGEAGEKSPELQDFIAEREKTRQDLKEIDECGFHMLLVFPEGFKQKAEFVEKCGVFKGAVAVDGGPYLDLVFESYRQKMDFAEELKLDEEDPDTGVPPLMYGLYCDGRAFARKMGVQLSETGLHFRDRVIDKQLAEMAMPHERQKTEQEIQEEIFMKLKAERKELGMPTAKKGRRTKDDPGDGIYISEEDEPENEQEER